MAASTWAEITTANTLADIDPGRDPTITPAQNDYVGRGMTLGLLAWTGGVWDDGTGTFWIPLGGGHTDYGGNEPYRIRLDADEPRWVMVRKPTGAIGNTGITRDGKEATGLYFDGRLRSVHSYNNQCYVPGLGPVISRLTGCYYTAAISPANTRAYWLDEQGEAHLISDYSAQGGGSPLLSTADGAVAYDPTRGRRGTLWSVGHNSSRLVEIDIATGAAVARTPPLGSLASADAMHYLAEYDVLAIINRGNLKIWRIDRGDYATYTPVLTGNYSGGLDITLQTGFGSCWSTVGRQLCLYENRSRQLGEISTLTPTGGPVDTWIRGVLPIAPSNTVLPPTLASSGLFGRFGFSQMLRGFFLIPSTRSKPYFFATE
jgi:hypothetical protein